MARDHIGTGLPARLVWSYDEPRGRLAQLYDEGKSAQWDLADLDWSVLADPGALPDPDYCALGTGDVDWGSLGDPLTAALGTEPDVVRDILTQQHAWLVSQLLHGEQGALVAMAKVCAAADSVDAKSCAALQVADEARHVEAYRRYLDTIGIRYGVSPALEQLLDQAIGHRSLDVTYLGTQILVENIGLIAADLGNPVFGNRLLCQIVDRIRGDEARHTDVGAALLDGLYADMDPIDRREREDFVLEACATLKTALRPVPVWEHFGIDVASAAARYHDSPDAAAFHALAFRRVVPDLQRLGLLTTRVRQGFEALGVLDFAEIAAGAEEPEESRGGGPAGAAARRTDRPAGDEDDLDVRPAGMTAGEAPDPLLALRAALGCVEHIGPEPVLMAMSELVGRPRLAGVPRAQVRLAISGAGDGDWLVTFDDDRIGYRRSEPADRADVTVTMDLVTWTEIVSGRATMPAALAAGRIAVAGDVFKARALEALL